jgi:hypothetical protein
MADRTLAGMGFVPTIPAHAMTDQSFRHCGSLRVSLAPVRAGLGIDAFVGKLQALDRASGNQVLLNNFGGVCGLDAAVPDRLRVDNDGGAVLALVQAERFVDADAVGNSGSFGQLLQLGVQFTFAIAGARWAGRAGGANVMANKDVMLKGRQSKIPP